MRVFFVVSNISLMYSACYTSTIFYSLNIHTYGRVLWCFISNKFTVGLGLLVTISYALIVWRWAAYHKESAFVVIVYIYRWARVSLCEEHAAITGKLGKKNRLKHNVTHLSCKGLNIRKGKNTHTHKAFVRTVVLFQQRRFFCKWRLILAVAFPVDSFFL